MLLNLNIASLINFDRALESISMFGLVHSFTLLHTSLKYRLWYVFIYLFIFFEVMFYSFPQYHTSVGQLIFKD